MWGIQIDRNGGAEEMHWRELPDPTLGAGEVLVDLAAAGLNYIDTYQRSGLYTVPLPYVLGLEGSGIVAGLGDDVADLAVGDAVAWATVPGSYATRVAVPAAQLMRVPDGTDMETAAALPLQGMTAHFLTTDTFPLAAGDRCLIHAGAGGVGLLLIQIAKLKGAEVFTTVGSPDKAELASAAGADHTILYQDVDFAESIRAITGHDRPIDVVYDGVGKSVFARSLTIIRPARDDGHVRQRVGPARSRGAARPVGERLAVPRRGRPCSTTSPPRPRSNAVPTTCSRGWPRVASTCGSAPGSRCATPPMHIVRSPAERPPARCC